MKQNLTTMEFAAMMENIAPSESAVAGDNCGLILDLRRPIKKVLVCLDVTNSVMDEAEHGSFDTIVSHHPPVFTSLNKFSVADPTGNRLIRAIRLGLNLYAAHTSYDAAPVSGMSMALGRQMGLCGLTSLCVEKKAADGSIVSAMGAIGCLRNDMKIDDFVAHVKNSLKAASIRVVAGQRKKIRRVACMGGAGGDYVKTAAEQGADAFVVGEVKHHHFEEAANLGIMLLEAGHYDTETVFVSEVCQGLQNYANALEYNIEVYGSVAGCRPYVVI